MKKLILALSLIAFSVIGTAQKNTKFAKIDSLLTYFTENNKFMGSLSIMENGEVLFDKAYGYSDVDKKIKATTATKYKIGSITKMFTAVVAFQLVDEGKLRLETKLSRYYPKVPNADKITIGNLMNHRSGIFNFTDDPKFMQSNGTTITKEQMLANISSHPSIFEPNSKSEYSNSNYMLLGYIIEDITKKSYAENIEERIISKLKLEHTQYYTTIDPSKNEAYSYNFENNKWVQYPEWNNTHVFAAGAIQSTPNDLNVFIQALFSGQLLKPKSFQEMTRLEDNYGKGILTFPFGERRFFGHNGGIEAFSSALGYYPAEKLSFALTINGSNYNSNDIILGILSTLYKMPYRFPNLKTVAVDKAILAKYSGVYSTESFPLKITIKEEKGVLVAQATGQSAFPLNAISTTEFVFDEAGLQLDFSENTMVLKQGGMVYKLKKE